MKQFKYLAIIKKASSIHREHNIRISHFANKRTSCIITAYDITEARAKAWDKGILCKISLIEVNSKKE